MTPNATVEELAGMALAVGGSIVAMIVFTGSLILLVGRYQDRRNGAVRLLAWQFAIVCGLSWMALSASLLSAGFSVMLPPRTQPLQPGLETAVAELAISLSPWLRLAIILGLIGPPVVYLFIGLRLRPYYTAEKYSADYHPNRRSTDAPQGDAGKEFH